MTARFQLPSDAVQAFARDGAVVLRGLLNADELAQLTAGIEHNLAHLSPLALVASSLARAALSAFWRTVAVICSIDAAVSSRALHRLSRCSRSRACR
jgi:hypothetical protein